MEVLAIRLDPVAGLVPNLVYVLVVVIVLEVVLGQWLCHGSASVQLVVLVYLWLLVRKKPAAILAEFG